jgi:hypothetical protein
MSIIESNERVKDTLTPPTCQNQNQSQLRVQKTDTRTQVQLTSPNIQTVNMAPTTEKTRESKKLTADHLPAPSKVQKKQKQNESNSTQQNHQVSKPGPAVPEQMTPAQRLDGVRRTAVNENFTETDEEITNRQLRETCPTQIEPTRMRISPIQKQRLIDSNRAIFLALAKHVKENRASIHTLLREHIVNIAPTGMIGIQTSNDTYYAILFKNTELRDKAIGTLRARAFVVQEVPIPLYIQIFGEITGRPNVIWHITASILSREKDIRKAVKTHCQQHHPTFSSTFEVRAKKYMGIRTGEFYVRFDSPPPRTLVRRMHVGDDHVIINQEPLYLCRFCNRSGHILFQCPNESTKSLSKHVSKGSVGNTDTSEQPNETTTFENTLAEFEAEERDVDMGE